MGDLALGTALADLVAQDHVCGDSLLFDLD